MNLPPIYDLFRKHGFRFVNGPNKFETSGDSDGGEPPPPQLITVARELLAGGAS